VKEKGKETENQNNTEEDKTKRKEKGLFLTLNVVKYNSGIVVMTRQAEFSELCFP